MTQLLSDSSKGTNEYRGTINNFVEWSAHNNLHLNTTKTKEIVVDFRRGRRRRTQPTPNITRDTEVEVVANHRYLSVQLDSELDWKRHMDVVYRKGQSRLFSVRIFFSPNYNNVRRRTTLTGEKRVRNSSTNLLEQVIYVWL